MDEIILLSMSAIRLAGLHLTYKNNNNCYCYNIVRGLSFSDDLNVTRGFFLKVLSFSSFMKMDSHLIKSGCGTMLIRCDRATGYLIRWQIKGTLKCDFSRLCNSICNTARNGVNYCSANWESENYVLQKVNIRWGRQQGVDLITLLWWRANTWNVSFLTPSLRTFDSRQLYQILLVLRLNMKVSFLYN